MVRDHLGDLGVDRRMMLGWILEKLDVKLWRIDLTLYMVQYRPFVTAVMNLRVL
jgi:hypothetical protein